jgi:chromosome segregation ATPase
VAKLFETFSGAPSDGLTAALRDLAAFAGGRAVQRTARAVHDQLVANCANKKASEVQDLTLARERADNAAGVVEREGLRAELAAARTELRSLQLVTRRELAETQSELAAVHAELATCTTQKAEKEAECGTLGSALESAQAEVKAHELGASFPCA